MPSNLIYVRTFHSQNGGWNGTYGFRTLEDAEDFRQSYAVTFPGSRTEFIEENIDNADRAE